jgi:hypothetical protein
VAAIIRIRNLLHLAVSAMFMLVAEGQLTKVSVAAVGSDTPGGSGASSNTHALQVMKWLSQQWSVRWRSISGQFSRILRPGQSWAVIEI